MTKYIGYWNTESNLHPEFPFPRIQNKRDTSKEIQMIEFLINLKTTKQVHIKGFSICRCCGEMNGSSEYEIFVSKKLKLIIPEGYKHYIEKHFIELDPEILKAYDYIKGYK